MYDYLCMRNVLGGTYAQVNCWRHDVCDIVTLETEVNVGVDIGCLETLCHQFKLTSSFCFYLRFTFSHRIFGLWGVCDKQRTAAYPGPGVGQRSASRDVV
jgi:hypothetical protein